MVIVATGGPEAARLTGIPAPRMNALTTFHFATSEAPTRRPLLRVDGEQRGPVVNTVVMDAAAPAYAPADRHLVSASTLGADASSAAEAAVRAHLARVWRTDTSRWDLVGAYPLPHALPDFPAGTPLRRSLAATTAATASSSAAITATRRPNRVRWSPATAPPPPPSPGCAERSRRVGAASPFLRAELVEVLEAVESSEGLAQAGIGGEPVAVTVEEVPVAGGVGAGVVAHPLLRVVAAGLAEVATAGSHPLTLPDAAATDASRIGSEALAS